MKIIIEEYDKHKHGPMDDCDYVIIHDMEPKSVVLGIKIAEGLGYSVKFGDIIIDMDKIYLCHS